ncbi:hypothetical protein [Streptomyces albicerus]|uniref:hypothetical protein n=1 Tax=Streptomyces albicerus TaxID=2569859 RepID=UPI001788B998|nr:hypothetical protein [Streptomyces albicerus]
MGVVITLIVLLILNWSSIVSYVKGSDSSKPSPTPSASGPCPKQLAAKLPEGSGAKLVAAYSRETGDERYAFCRTKEEKLFLFLKQEGGKSYLSPMPAEESKSGYLVRVLPASYRFRDGEITAYQDGKEVWKEKLVPESSVD